MLLVAALVGPALLLATMAWWSWERVNRETEAAITRNVDLLHEHAERQFQVDTLLLARMDERVANLDWAQIIAREPEFYRDFNELVRDAGDVDGALLIDPSGEPRVATNHYPVPSRTDPVPTRSNLADRKYFAELRDGASITIDGPYRGRLGGRQIFNIARRLSSPEGAFRGVALLSISPTRFSNFWRSAALPGDTVSLVTADGTVLARYPEASVGLDGKPPHFSDATMAQMRARPAGLAAGGRSPIDGVIRLVGFRKLNEYPLYIVYAVDRANIRRDWYPTLAAFGGVTLLACAGLLLTSLTVIRRAQREAEALSRLELTAAALRRSEESQRALFRNAPVPMHALDRDRRLIDVNEYWLALFGYERAEVIGRPITDFLAPGCEAFEPEDWRSALTSQALWHAERRYRTKSGAIIDAVISGRGEFDSAGRFVRAISTVTDVTARRQAEEAARRERLFSELLIESSAEGIIGIDSELRYTLWNPKMEAISGLSRRDIIGKTVLENFPHLAGTPIEAGWKAAIAGEQTQVRDWPFEYLQSGRKGFFDQTFAPLYGPDQSIIGAISFVHDNTERHQVEASLRQAQKMEAVGQLTGGVAHDFNNLLTVIISGLDMVLSAPEDSARVRRLIGAALNAATRGERLTQQLLAFARRQPLRPEIVVIDRLIAEFAPLISRAIGETIELRTRYGAPGMSCRIDRSQFETAILNLAVNSRDAIGAGPGTIIIETRPASVRDLPGDAGGETPAGDYVIVAVSDTGCGIPAELRPRVFEPFFTTKDVGKGSGLGLSQVYGFVKQSGGAVALESEIGAGTRITLYLPRHSEAVPAHAAPAPPSEATTLPTGGETVLVVEDDSEVRAMAMQALQALGYRALAAQHGPEALELLRGSTPVDLLFTDLVMPHGMSGIELARQARLLRSDLRILLTTGYRDHAEGEAGDLPAGLSLLPKPYRSADLAQAIRAALSGASRKPQD